jgi:hypothetical protein
MADGRSAPVMPCVQQGCTCGCPSAEMDHAVRVIGETLAALGLARAA